MLRYMDSERLDGGRVDILCIQHRVDEQILDQFYRWEIYRGDIQGVDDNITDITGI